MKLWCADKKNTREDRRADPAGVGYDIPDFMTVNGRYTSRMSTKERKYISNEDFELGSCMNNNQMKFLKNYILMFQFHDIFQKKAFSSVSDFALAKAAQSNTQFGVASFKEENNKYKKTEADDGNLGGNIGATVGG